MKLGKARIKLFVVIVLFCGFAAAMFTFGYGIIEDRNQVRLDLISQKNLELEVLKREQKNFEQGKKDLENIEQRSYPPQDLFSKDTRVVKEIRELESLAARYSLEFALSVTGSSADAPKATGVGSELLQVPYQVSVVGGFNNILKYIKASEHTSFVTQTHAIDFSAEGDGRTRAAISSQFYLKP